MKKSRILLVEDDQNLGFVMRDNLTEAGFQIVHCTDGLTAQSKFETESFDLCILDVMLPGLDGFNLGSFIREKNKDIPILFVTARDHESDRLDGFNRGADDYITKPFSIKELIMRIRVFLKRSSGTDNGHSLEFGNARISEEDQLLYAGEKEIKLTRREADLMAYFFRNRNQVCKRESILLEIWGDDDYFLGRSLDVFVSRLRKKLEPDSALRIMNYHGVGFKLVEKK